MQRPMATNRARTAGAAGLGPGPPRGAAGHAHRPAAPRPVGRRRRRAPRPHRSGVQGAVLRAAADPEHRAHHARRPRSTATPGPTAHPPARHPARLPPAVGAERLPPGRRRPAAEPDGGRRLPSAASGGDANGTPLQINSGYRSIAQQREIFRRRLGGWSTAQIASGQADGAIEAVLAYHSIPGYSKHHTGVTMDLSTRAVRTGRSGDPRPIAGSPPTTSSEAKRSGSSRAIPTAPAPRARTRSRGSSSTSACPPSAARPALIPVADPSGSVAVRWRHLHGGGHPPRRRPAAMAAAQQQQRRAGHDPAHLRAGRATSRSWATGTATAPTPSASAAAPPSTSATPTPAAPPRSRSPTASAPTFRSSGDWDGNGTRHARHPPRHHLPPPQHQHQRPRPDLLLLRPHHRLAPRRRLGRQRHRDHRHPPRHHLPPPQHQHQRPRPDLLLLRPHHRRPPRRRLGRQRHRHHRHPPRHHLPPPQHQHQRPRPDPPTPTGSPPTPDRRRLGRPLS